MAETLTLPVDIQPSQVETGMNIRIHQKITELGADGKEKERVQVYEGVVMSVGGKGVSKTMTVRKVSGGIGVEKIFPLTLPSIQRIELTRKIKARRKVISFIRDTKKRLREVKDIKLRKA